MSSSVVVGREGMHFHWDAIPWETWYLEGESAVSQVGLGQDWAFLGESGRSPDCNRIYPFFQQHVWFPCSLWDEILRTKALSRFRWDFSLASVAQLVGRHLTKQKVASLIPGQDTRLGCSFVPGQGTDERHPINVYLSYQCFSSSLSHSLPLSF